MGGGGVGLHSNDDFNIRHHMHWGGGKGAIDSVDPLVNWISFFIVHILQTQSYVSAEPLQKKYALKIAHQ